MKKIILFAAVLLSHSSFAQNHMGLTSGWEFTHSTLAIGIDPDSNTAHIATVSKDTNIKKGDYLGNIEFYSNDAEYNGTPKLCGYIRSIANLYHTLSRCPTYLSFGTTTDDTTAPDTKMILTSSGSLMSTGSTLNHVYTYSQDTIALGDTDRTVLVNAENYPVVVEVPKPSFDIGFNSLYSAGVTYIIKKVDATNNNVTIKPPAGSAFKFDGASTITLSKPNSSVTIQCDGVGYKILATNFGTDLFSAGTGINITGGLITNTGDLSITNEIQNLSATQTGSNVSVNISGGTSASFSVQEPTTVLTSNATAAVNNRYISNSGTQITVTLPATAAVGDVVYIVGLGSGGWKIAQDTSQIIHGNSDTTPGTGGSLESGARYNCAELRCVAANSDWVIVNSMGTLTFN